MKHPKGKRWLSGPASACKYHVRATSKRLSYREGRSFRRKADREAGVVGKQQAGWIDG